MDQLTVGLLVAVALALVAYIYVRSRRLSKKNKK